MQDASTARTVELFSGSGNSKGFITIYPVPEPCGVHHNACCAKHPASEWHEGCPTHGHLSTGGRMEELYDAPPDGFSFVRLTAPETDSVRSAIGYPECERYVIRATVHGSYKIQKHQGIVLTKAR